MESMNVSEKPKIIVADDDPATLMMYSRILERRYDVRTCTNGMDLLAEFAMDHADLVILDNEMPEMDGSETTEALRQSSLSWNVPIIIVSAQDDEEHILEGLSYGANDYIVKPVKPPELLAKVTVALRKRQFANAGPDLGPGSVFNGRYQIDRILGEGGYSRVFAARNIKMDTGEVTADPWVALKVFGLPGFASREKSMAYFLREAYEHARLDHKNIVKLFDFGQVDSYYFLAMELLEGVTLADRVGMGDPLPEEEIIYIASEVADALSFFESQDLIHRDIKPSNIMLVVGHGVKLLDFGLAKNPNEETINLEEVFRGTPHYTSPEQILNDKTIDIKSDIYSLGATLYAAATAVKPFDADSTMGILRRHLNEKPAPLLKLRPDLNPTLARLIEQCLSRHRKDRPSIGEFKAVCDILTVT